MSCKSWGWFFSVIGIIIIWFVFPEISYALGNFESKMERLRDSLTGTLLPLVSTLGLIYAAILAISGSGESKGKVITVIVMSIVGFLAQYIIEFLKGITG